MIGLKVKRIIISANDMADGPFNRETVPQYGFVPRLALSAQNFTTLILPLEIPSLEDLVIEPQILEHLEVNPAIVKTLLEAQQGISYASLRMCDV